MTTGGNCNMPTEVVSKHDHVDNEKWKKQDGTDLEARFSSDKM